MALSEQEEFELLSLERERANGSVAPQPATPQKHVFAADEQRPVRDTLLKMGRGFLQGGPLGLAAAGVGSAMENIDQTADTAGGATADALAKVLPPEAAAAAGTAVKLAPTLIGGMVGRSAGAPVMEKTAKGLMHSALKPQAKDVLSGDAGRAIDTLLKEGANVSTGGAVKLRARISQLENEARKLVDDAAQRGEVVDKAYVMSEIAKELTKFRNQVNPGADTQAVLKSWDEFRQLIGAKIPVAEAHALKKGTYGILADKYAKQGTVENVPGTQAQMAMARGLRKGSEAVVPGLGKVTAEESQLINALEMAERRAGISGNKDVAGIAFLANNPVAASAMMVDRSSAFKSWLANKIYQARNSAPAAAGAGAMGVYQGSQQDR